ncbi:MAG: hypothetical protein P9L99_19825 [Candidatus Lernaella stagnicola]|nr:hypothetical protein [Candidatus Lernaella stagnicola]
MEAKRTAAVTGRIRMSVSVRFSLFANASRSVDANDGVLSLAADVETALMREWKNGTSADNLSTACAADFILWQFDKLGRVKHSPQKRSTAHAFDLWMTAVLHRPFDQP